MCVSLTRPEESIRSPGPIVTSGCEGTEVGSHEREADTLNC